ncbi:MAG TPA: hypothetical protein VEL07_21850 [Planctomycetota bacterium]|nr:hypothetical protein [Planctomycetota bacterium]
MTRPLALLVLAAVAASAFAVDAPPTVATPASASPSPVTAKTTVLNVLGADDGGAAALTYTWSAVTVPTGAAVTFSPNATNAARTSTATFNRIGTYVVRCTIRDVALQSVTSDVSVTVNPTYTSVVVSPSPVYVNPAATQAFTASAKDQFGVSLVTQPAFTWTTSGGGTIASTGVYTAGSTAGGPHTMTATSGTVSGTATAYIKAVPRILSAAASTANPVTGTTTTLTVTATDDDGGEPNLIYAWRVNGTPPADVVFGRNGTNAAKAVNATFAAAGTYSLSCLITDQDQYSVTANLSLTVNRTLTSIQVTPADTGVAVSTTRAFTARGHDQFGIQLVTQPTWTWAASGGGTIATTGVYTASATPGGPYTITATSGTINGTTTARVVAAAFPRVATVAAAAVNPVTTTSTTLTVLGSDDGGEPALTYTWAYLTAPANGSVSFAPNGTNPAKSTTATFTRAGAYVLQVRIRDAQGQEVTSNVNVTVNAMATAAITVTPTTQAINPGASCVFAAAANDQFAQPLTVYTWSVAGGGVIGTTTGVFTANATSGGPWTVTARSGTFTGTATVSVNSAIIAALQTAIRTDAFGVPSRPERLTALVIPPGFNQVQHDRNPLAYRNIPEPGRVWQQAAPSATAIPLKTPSGTSFSAARGGTVNLAVKTAPNAPVTFTGLDGGTFTVSGVSVLTVQGNANGDVTVAYVTPNRAGEARVLASSPMAVGQAVFRVDVQ